MRNITEEQRCPTWGTRLHLSSYSISKVSKLDLWLKSVREKSGRQRGCLSVAFISVA